MSDIERNVYEFDAIWDVEFMGEDATARIRETVLHVPNDAQSLLDVGCGNGLFLTALLEGRSKSQFKRLAGADRSIAALKRVNVEKAECDISALPFQEREFDVVSCLQVLEHLPNNILNVALGEIARVAKKHVLITVPYRENLEEDFVVCAECGTRFNPNYHIHSFDESRVSSLFSGRGFSCREIFLMYPMEVYVGFDFIKKRILRRENSFPWWTNCPACGYGVSQPQTATGAPATRGQIGRWVRKLWPKTRRHMWIGALYERDS